MLVHGGSIPYSETVGLQVLLLGLAHGGMTSAALSTNTALGHSPKAARTKQWVWHEVTGCLCVCWGKRETGTTADSLFLGKSQQVRCRHLQGCVLDLTHRRRGGTAKVRAPLQLVSKRCKQLWSACTPCWRSEGSGTKMVLEGTLGQHSFGASAGTLLTKLCLLFVSLLPLGSTWAFL